MIKLTNINRSFKVGKELNSVLKNITLEVEKGEFLSIMGPSGSGKSTLINILGFIDNNYDGEYLFNNKKTHRMNDNETSELRNTTVGFVFQNFKLIGNDTIIENTYLPLIYNGIKRKERIEKAKKILELVGLKDKELDLPKNLSGGQQQRVAIARALINNPEFIIADEPTGALDSNTSKEIMRLFKKINRDEGATIIIVTHDRFVAEQTQRIINIFDGKIDKEEIIS